MKWEKDTKKQVKDMVSIFTTNGNAYDYFSNVETDLTTHTVYLSLKRVVKA